MEKNVQFFLECIEVVKIIYFDIIVDGFISIVGINFMFSGFNYLVCQFGFMQIIDFLVQVEEQMCMVRYKQLVGGIDIFRFQVIDFFEEFCIG